MRTQIGCIVSRQDPLRSTYALDPPSSALRRSKNPARSSTGPRTHATVNRISIDSRGSSPASIRSAKTRSASASALPIASVRVWPYFITPGRPITSAIQRPSCSRSVSIVRRISHPSDRKDSSLAEASDSLPRPARPSWEKAGRPNIRRSPLHQPELAFSRDLGRSRTRGHSCQRSAPDRLHGPQSPSLQLPGHGRSSRCAVPSALARSPSSAWSNTASASPRSRAVA